MKNTSDKSITEFTGNLRSVNEHADSVAFKQKMFVPVQMANALGEQRRRRFNITTVYTASLWDQQVDDALWIKGRRYFPQMQKESHIGV